jgi:hypothetical protein
MKKIHTMWSFVLFQINEKSAHNVQVYCIPKLEITLKLLSCYVSTLALTTSRVGSKFEACSRVASMGVKTLLTLKIIDLWKKIQISGASSGSKEIFELLQCLNLM